jgi:hypothetical protein
MGCKLLRMGMVGLSLAALTLPLRSAGAHASSGKDPFVGAERLCTHADGRFTVNDNLQYTCEGEDLYEGLVKAARAFCTHAFFTGGSFTRTPADGSTPIVSYNCLIPGA